MHVSIRTVCNFVISVPPSRLKSKEILEINKTYPFSHYMICTLNRLRIKPNSIITNGMLTNFIILEQINEYEWKEHAFSFLGIINNKKITIQSTGKEVNLIHENGQVEYFENIFLFLIKISYKNNEIHTFIEKFLLLNIEYIGQTEISKGYLRFKTHEKKNDITDEIIESYPHKEVIVKLMSFPKPFTSAISDLNAKNDNFRMDWLPGGSLLEKIPIDNLKTLIEGTLIKYFMPKHNIHYKNNFPSITHTGYKYFYEKDIRSVSVELHEENMAYKSGNENVPYTRTRLIEYSLCNDNNEIYLHNNEEQNGDELINILKG